ncbi:MAG: phosphatase/phosphohexomutase [uncultured bacterium]|nr:MAG: phosphatase/phosphohexomutase [uncultured bacterium]OGJ47797.1 MAG: hypothetical protein A2244_04115 [Candidatus Peregrinibacteria bacterium RIFOXYA2_FULL_41_18]OGJ49104.1 MAG: hypothetical protein A2344_06025 [Candidatus Peregrinibacteria bacterium RIFOXYB12_FULL_41_12]OGJ52851.1 MAG: hypothetical protein A2336_05185 [Candidatus Peregrinibacteria bacterium RIFOXYB2_FULL_41_88]
MIKAIIFDLDGTLIDSEKLHLKAELETLKTFGIKAKKEKILGYMGMGIKDYFQVLKEKFNAHYSIEKIVKAHVKTLEKYYGGLFPAVSNTKKTIRDLSKRYTLALGTSAHTRLAKMCLKRLGIAKYFKVITGGDKVKHAKPHPEIFLLIAKKLKIKPQEIVVIEDSTNGFKAAKSAGMQVIARIGSHNKSEDFSLADHKIKNLLKIKTYLKYEN